MTRNDNTAAATYPYEPGEDGTAAYVRFNMAGHSYTATAYTVDALQSWIESNRDRIVSYTIVTPGDMSSAALVRITDELLAGIDHVYTTPCGRGWDWTLAGIRQWEQETMAAQEEAVALHAMQQAVAAHNERAELLASAQDCMEVGDELQMWRNQANRDAVVVAVQAGGDRCVVEYVMPSGVTYLVDMPMVAVYQVNRGKASPESLEDVGRTFGKRYPRWAVEQLESEERAYWQGILQEYVGAW